MTNAKTHYNDPANALSRSARVGPLQHDGAPIDGTSGTDAGIAPRGCLLVDTAGAALYINVGTPASPTWQPVGAGD